MTPNAEGWQVMIQNKTDRAIKLAQLVIQPMIHRLGEIPAGQSKTFTVKADEGTDLRTFVQQHAPGFFQAVQQRQYAFGSSQGGRINDLNTATMAASFIQKTGIEDHQAAGIPATKPARATPQEAALRLILYWSMK